MKIFIDIVHMADVNFYKNAIAILKKQGHEIILTVMDRGNLPIVVRKELGEGTIIGKHGKGFRKIFFNLDRVFRLRRFIRKAKPDVVSSFSYYPAAAVKFFKARSVIFHDDPEYKLQFALCKFFADKLVLPDFLDIKGKKIVKYHSYKEWAYLNPEYFKPKLTALKEYKLTKGKYVFIREIAKVSLNYTHGTNSTAQLAAELQKSGYKVLLSLEDKSRKDEFKGCIILEEPVKDIYSLMFYSKAVISTGDTMIREAALMGVPSFYLGKRDMNVNRKLIEKKLIIPIEDHSEILEKLNKKPVPFNERLDDTTKTIVKEILR